MDFSTITLNENIKTMQNYVIWILKTLLFILKLKIFFKDIAENVKKRFDTSNYEVDRPLPKQMNKNMIGLMKDILGGKIITEFVALRPQTYSYLTHDDENVIKAKGAK